MAQLPLVGDEAPAQTYWLHICPYACDVILWYSRTGDYKHFELKETRDEPVKQLVRKKVDGKMVNARDEVGEKARRWIGCDQSRIAIAITADRVAKAIEEKADGGASTDCKLTIDKPRQSADNSGISPGSSFGEPGAKPPQGGFCVNASMKTIVYVDGFNLYYGAVKGTPYRWLNSARMCELLLPRDRIRQIKYFTALVKPRPHDPDQRVRQETYLRALATIPALSVTLGYFLTHEVTMPLAGSKGGYATFIKHIRASVLAKSQFLPTLTDANGTFSKPPTWSITLWGIGLNRVRV